MSAASGLSAVQKRASDPAASVFVSASAGTGKTHILTARVLRLLLSGTPPGKILCLTYTKAAAAEMLTRIQAVLGAWAGLDDAALMANIHEKTGQEADAVMLSRARTLFAVVLDAPDGLKIQTLHGFCQSVLGRFPAEAGIPARFAVLEDRNAEERLSGAIEEALTEAGEEKTGPLRDALDRIGARMVESTFEQAVRKMLEERHALKRLLEIYTTLPGIRTALEVALGLEPGLAAARIRHDACLDRVLDLENLRAACALLAGGSANETKMAARMQPFLAAAEEDRAACFDLWCSAFLTQADEIAKRNLTKATREKHLLLAEALDREAERLKGIKDALVLREIVGETMDLLTLGARVLRHYEARKQARGEMDFDDLVATAAALFGREGIAPWILYKLDNGIDHILVDEAQDTNPMQWRIVDALTAEFFAGEGARDVARTLFAVGDVKQSIYGFQKADPAAFEDAEDRIGAAARGGGFPFVSLPLFVSYRSVPLVLKLADAVFAGDAARQGLSRRDAEIHHEAFRAGAAGRVELWPVADGDDANWPDVWIPPVEQEREETPEARLAARIADRIAHMIGSGEMLPARGRPVRAGDFLVLVRRRTAFSNHLVRHLKAQDIPVAGNDRIYLSDELAVMDLIALAEAALMPDDDLTLATVLKSPVIGLGEAELFDLAWPRGNEETLMRALCRMAGSDPRFANAYERLLKMFALAERSGVYDFFAGVLTSFGVRKALKARLGAAADDALDELLNLAAAYERTNVASLQGFLHWYRAKPAEVKRDAEGFRDEVRIMTVHGSKGLEAPIVILPDTCSLPRGNRGWLKLPPAAGALSAEPLLIPAPSKERSRGRLAELAGKARAESGAEDRRLLYVALTRAEDMLIAAGYAKDPGKLDEGCWYNLIRAGFGKLDGIRRLEDGTLIAEEGQTAPVKDDKREQAGRGGPVPVPDWVRRPAPPEPKPSRPLAPSRLGMETGAAASPLATGSLAASPSRFARGKIIHKLLELLPGLERTARQAATDAVLAQPHHALDAAARADIAASVARVLDDPLFAPLFGPGSLAEAALAGIVDGQAVTARIDRLMVTENEILIVDYKTNRPPPVSLDRVPDGQIRQLALYTRLSAAIWPDRPVRAALLYTESAHLLHIPHARLLGTPLLDGTAPAS